MTIHRANDTTIVHSVAIPITNDRRVTGKSKDEWSQLRIRVTIVVQIPTQELLVISREHRFLTHRSEVIDSVSVPVADPQNITVQSKSLSCSGESEKSVNLLAGITVRVNEPRVKSFAEKVAANGIAKVSRGHQQVGRDRPPDSTIDLKVERLVGRIRFVSIIGEETDISRERAERVRSQPNSKRVRRTGSKCRGQAVGDFKPGRNCERAKAEDAVACIGHLKRELISGLLKDRVTKRLNGIQQVRDESIVENLLTVTADGHFRITEIAHQPDVRSEPINEVVLNGVGVIPVCVEMPRHQRRGCTAAIDIPQIVGGVTVPIAGDWLRAGRTECDHRILKPGKCPLGSSVQMPHQRAAGTFDPADIAVPVCIPITGDRNRSSDAKSE